jgi:chondroitin 4-sulfotransferase 11
VISHKHKFIFVHIPKCAGTSIENLFTPDVNWWLRKTNLGSEQHLTIGEMKRINKYNEHLSTYFKFSVIRNPWSRFLSAYKFAKNGFRKTRCSFKEFCLNTQKNCPQKGPHKPYYRYIKTQQFDYLCDGSGEIVVDFICKLENLQEDFNIICDKIGIPRKQLPHTNKSKHKHYTEYYDEETRQIVAEKYKKDIEYFGYEFGE